MARPKTLVPELKFHSLSGQGRVYLDGQYFYCGPFEDPETQAKYRKLVGQWMATGKVEEETHHAETVLTVADLTAEARSWIEFKYANDTGRRSGLLLICTILEDDAGDLPASKFGPRKLAEIRETLIASSNSRKYINQQVREIIRIFKFGVSRELVDINVVLTLQTLEPLRQGQTTARESDPVQPVDIEVVRATAKHLSPPIRAMVALQAATGMRPSEICAMKPKHIDKSGEVWIYRLDKHKTARHGIKKSVPIVDEARKALEPFLDRDPDDYCFKPAESEKWHRNQRTLNRKTPPSCGNRVGSTKSSKPRTFKECFDKDVYRRAIERAAKKAKVQHWFPYQLRHMAATEVRDALGVEAAAALLGHSKTSMTDHYARQKEAKAIEAAKAAPQLVF